MNTYEPKEERGGSGARKEYHARDYQSMIRKCGKDVCFVCEKPFRKTDRRVMIGLHRDTGAELWRHVACHPLSKLGPVSAWTGMRT